MLARRLHIFRTRVFAAFCVVSVLSGIGLDAHALLMGHGPQSPEAAAGSHAGHQHPPGSVDAHAGEELPGDSADAGCCHAAMCSSGAAAAPTGIDDARHDAGDPAPGAKDLALLSGLHHAPPLRPPR